MLRPLVLRSSVGPAHSVEPRDTRAVKRSLDRLGLYRPPAEGITDVADSGMFNGLKAFQRRRGLPADGVAEPGGPTEAALNEDLLRAAKGRDTSARRETRTRSSFTRRKASPAPAPARERQHAPRGHLSAKPGKAGTGLSPEGAPRSFLRGLPRPDRETPLVLQDAYRAFQFDPKGPERDAVAALNPVSAAWARITTNQVRTETLARQNRKQLPGGLPWNNAADAFRHALWNYKLTKRIGAEAAKRITDAHEITEVNELNERLMDLYNNEIGRRLAMDPRNQDRPAGDVVMDALKKGLLRTEPFPLASCGTSSR